MKSLAIVVLVLMMVVNLAACGVKPSSVKPPKDSKDVYPRSYPAPEASDLPANADGAAAE